MKKIKKIAYLALFITVYGCTQCMDNDIQEEQMLPEREHSFIASVIQKLFFSNTQLHEKVVLAADIMWSSLPNEEKKDFWEQLKKQKIRNPFDTNALARMLTETSLEKLDSCGKILDTWLTPIMFRNPELYELEQICHALRSQSISDWQAHCASCALVFRYDLSKEERHQLFEAVSDRSAAFFLDKKGSKRSLDRPCAVENLIREYPVAFYTQQARLQIEQNFEWDDKQLTKDNSEMPLIVVATLLAIGGNPNEATNDEGNTPLHTTILYRQDHTPFATALILRMLFEYQADPNATNSKGDTALHELCQQNSIHENTHALIYFLLQHGAQAGIKNNKNWTPLDYAQRNVTQVEQPEEYQPIVELLKKNIASNRPAS